jgi:hypothetical protein
MLHVSLSPRHSVSSDCGWRRRPPDIEGSCEYIEEATSNSRRGVVIQSEGRTRGLQVLIVKTTA